MYFLQQLHWHIGGIKQPLALPLLPRLSPFNSLLTPHFAHPATPFWLRQEPKESLFLSVRYKVLSLHLSGSNLQAISQKSFSSQTAVGQQSDSSQAADFKQSSSSPQAGFKLTLSTSSSLFALIKSIIRAFHLESHPSEPKILRLVYLLLTLSSNHDIIKTIYHTILF